MTRSPHRSGRASSERQILAESEATREPVLPIPQTHALPAQRQRNLTHQDRMLRVRQHPERQLVSGNVLFRHLSLPHGVKPSVLRFPAPAGPHEDRPTLQARPGAAMGHFLEASARLLVEFLTPPGGLVLDPFGGWFSTALACEESGYRWVAPGDDGRVRRRRRYAPERPAGLSRLVRPGRMKPREGTAQLNFAFCEIVDENPK